MISLDSVNGWVDRWMDADGTVKYKSTCLSQRIVGLCLKEMKRDKKHLIALGFVRVL